MKRPLMVLAAGYVLGEVLVLQVHGAEDMARMACVYAVAAMLLWWEETGALRRLLIRKKSSRKRGSRVFLLFLSCLLLSGGCGAWRAGRERNRLDEEERWAALMQDVRLIVKGAVSGIKDGESHVTLTLTGAVAQAGNRSAGFDRIEVFLNASGSAEDSFPGAEDIKWKVGSLVTLRGRILEAEPPRNPGEFDFPMYYRTKGISCRVYGEQILSVEGEGIPYYQGIASFRQGCAFVLDQICTPQDREIFKALLLGDSSHMDPGIRKMYQRNGISHLLAVSGQHLAIIGGGLYMLLRKGGGYRGAGLIASGFVISYGILTGSSGSAQRAVIMILCLWLGAERGRSYDSLSALGLSALILLGKNPYLLYHSGFQLSFGAVWAISGLGGWMRGRFKIRSWWQSGLLVSLCVQIVLTPVILYHYFQYPLYGMFLNLLIGPLVSIMMYSGILGICLGKFSLSAGILSVGAGHYILELYEWLCRMAEHLPGSCLVLGRPSVFSILLYVGVMTAVVWAAAEGAAIKEKGGKREEKEGAEKPGLAVSVLIVFYFLSLLIFIQHRGPGLEAVCLDVGQGDGLVLMEGKHTVLIDGGSSSQKKVGEKVLEPYLKSRGITHIDYGIVSHGDSDHINGLIYLLESSEDIDIDTLILPAMGRGEEVYRHMENLAAEKGTKVIYLKTGDRIEAGKLSFTCLYAGEENRDPTERNGHSLVLCGNYKGFHMLFTGDMGEEQEKKLLEMAEKGGTDVKEHLRHIQVLKVAHHGSSSSSSQAFLEYLDLKAALVSYGRDNSYGHPSPEVIRRLKDRKIQVFETGKQGAVILKTDGKCLKAKGFLKERAESHEKKEQPFPVCVIQWKK